LRNFAHWFSSSLAAALHSIRASFERAIIQERVRAGLRRAKAEGKKLGRPRIAPELEARILAALKAPGRTERVRKIAKRFGVRPGTVQWISRPFDGSGFGAAA
jgi:DNA invertase Pin-like site-specific DNA recombinase